MRCLAVVACLIVSTGAAQAQEGATVYYLNPDWAPDGTRIVFESGRDGHLSIYSIDVDGEGLHRLTGPEYNDEGPVWSPDGKQIAFFSNRRNGREERPVSLQVYVMDADGTRQRRLTDEGSALDYNVAWSPDGRRLVFQSRPEINPGVHSLYVVNADGTGRTRITDGRYNDTSPEWSPDGRSILFTRSLANYKFFQDRTQSERAAIEASTEIATLNLEDGTVTLVTQNQLPDFDPSWAPSGDAVLFLEDDGERRTLLRRSLRGSARAVVADGHLVSNSGGVTRTRLSPDGRFLAYAKEDAGAYGVYLYDLERREERLLVGGRREAQDSVGAGDPRAAEEALAAYVDGLIEPAADAEAFSGVVLVAAGDDIVYHEAFGYANWELSVPNARDTRFGIADLTMLLTRVAAGVIADEGLLDLGSPVERYIEGFPRGPMGGSATVEQLLRHRSGVAHRVTDPVEETQATDVVEIVKRRPLLFEPGTSRRFSHAGYVSLARVLAVAAAEPFDQILEDRVFRPARMASATGATQRRLMRRRASPYTLGADGTDRVVVNTAFKDLRFLAGAASVYATADDLFRFVRAAHGGIFGADLWDWTAESWRSRTGRFNGYEAYLDVLGARDVTLVIVTNLQTAVNEQVRARIHAYLVGDEVEEPMELPPPVVEQIEPQESLVGTYDDTGRPVTISLRDGHLFRGDVFGPDVEFYPITGGRYYIPTSGHIIAFRRDESGTVDALIRLRGEPGDPEVALPRVR